MSLVIAAAQSASVRGDIAGNIETHLRFGEAAAEHGVQLLVFPELSLTGYELAIAREHRVEPGSAVLDPLRDLAKKARMTIVAGAPVSDYIAALAFRPDGTTLVYTKVHVHESELHVFKPGSGGSDLIVDDATVALAICADVSFPQHARHAAERGARIYAAGVMIDEPGYARKMPLLKGYAVEHRMAVLMANYSGITGGEVSAGKSAIWAEDGAVVAESSGTQEELIVGTKENGVWTGQTFRPKIRH
jgi:predicted amidohydrolase